MSFNKKVLSLDQSLSCSGFTIYTENSLESFGAIRRPKEITETVQQLIFMINQIVKLLDDNKVELVVLEGLSLGINSGSTRGLAALYYNILSECYKRNIDYIVVPPTKVKKTAGSGTLGKQGMIDALPKEFLELVLSAGYKKSTGLADIADSYWIYRTFRLDFESQEI